MQSLLKQVKTILEGVFGTRLVKIVLYGSEARGEGGPDSDVDILVLLEGEPHDPEDSWACITSLYPLVLESGRPIHAEPVDVADFEAGEFPLYRNAAQEGVVL